MVTICTASLTFSNSTFCPHTVFMCSVWISEQTAIISLYNINWLVFITQTQCVYCAVRKYHNRYTALYWPRSTPLRNLCRFHFVLRPLEREVQDGSITVTTDRKSELENVSCLRNVGGGLLGCINAFSACFNCPIYVTSSVSRSECYDNSDKAVPSLALPSRSSNWDYRFVAKNVSY